MSTFHVSAIVAGKPYKDELRAESHEWRVEDGTLIIEFTGENLSPMHKPLYNRQAFAPSTQWFIVWSDK